MFRTEIATRKETIVILNETETFNSILKHFTEKYDLTVTRPYADGYMVISKNGTELGSFNADGHNLLHNLTELCKILKEELR